MNPGPRWVRRVRGTPGVGREGGTGARALRLCVTSARQHLMVAGERDLFVDTRSVRAASAVELSASLGVARDKRVSAASNRSRSKRSSDSPDKSCG